MPRIYPSPFDLYAATAAFKRSISAKRLLQRRMSSNTPVQPLRMNAKTTSVTPVATTTDTTCVRQAAKPVNSTPVRPRQLKRIIQKNVQVKYHRFNLRTFSYETILPVQIPRGIDGYAKKLYLVAGREVPYTRCMWYAAVADQRRKIPKTIDEWGSQS